jgi:phage tail-like protein
MTESALLRRLRPGRDSNGTTWVLARYLDDWRRARSHGVSFDAGQRALQLAARPAPELVAGWLPIAAVRAPDGTLYKADTARHLLLAQGPCDAGFAPVPGIGGRGFATGRLHTPLGVAVDSLGRVYVADEGNARVQVVVPHGREAAEVVAVLGEGLRRPVHVALGAHGEIFVADRETASVHVFSAAFAALRIMPLRTLDAWTQEPWGAEPPPRATAIATTADGTIVVFDPQRAELWHMSACGEALASLPWPRPDALPPGWAPLPRRYTAEGEVVLGPLDGGVYNFAWHEVRIEAHLPAGTALRVQTYAGNDAAPPVLPWAPRAPVAIVPAPGEAGTAESARLVLPESEGWERWRLGRLARARPALHRFEGGGPSSVDRITVPWQAARRLHVGDHVSLRTAAGGATTAAIVGAPDRIATVAARGPQAAFDAPDSVTLLQRRDGELPHGPVDLSFLMGAPAALAAPAARDGRSEPMPLPHGLASFLRAGDVIELASAASDARVEILETNEDDATFVLDAPVTGDFSVSKLTLDESAGRLVVAASLPADGPAPAASTLAVIDDVHTEAQGLAYIEAGEPGADLSTVWLARGSLTGHITPASWTHLQFPEPRATDHGRYLWVRMLLRGAALRPADGVGPPTLAEATPSVFALRATGPRPSLTRWLPAIFSRRDAQDTAPGANFLERFLTLFEGHLTQVEMAYESVGRLLNPRAADPQWLEFVATWLDLAFDPSWPVERRRQLVIEGAALQARRGTPAALARYLEIYTGRPAAIVEAFWRRAPLPIQLGARGALGVAPLAGEAGAQARRDASLGHRFSVSVTLPEGIERAAAASAVRQIVETMKPAHTLYTLDIGRATPARIGIDAAVDAIVIPGPVRADPCACDPDEGRGRVPRGHIDRPDGGLPGGFRLGGRLGRGGVADIEPQGAST